MKDRVLHLFLTVVVFIYILFEELFWETIAYPIYAYIHNLKLLKKLEHIILKLPSWLILTFFLLIFVQVEILGIFAGALFLDGKIVSATLLYLGKIPISAFAFWLFKISKEKLLSFNWFKISYDFIIAKIEWLKNTDIYKQIKIQTNNVKKHIKSWKRKYFKNANLMKNIKHIYMRIKILFK